MKTLHWILAMSMSLCTGAHAAGDECTQPAAVCEHAMRGALALIDRDAPATIVADDSDFPGVLRAARDLQADLAAVAGRPAALSTDREQHLATADPDLGQ